MFLKSAILIKLIDRRAIAYFKFILSYKFYYSLSNLEQNKLLIKTAYFLPDMEILFSKKLKPLFYRMCRKNKVYKS
jgi:hypothetical protein